MKKFNPEDSLKEITKNQFIKITMALLGKSHDLYGGITKIDIKAGKCAQVDGEYYADDKALKLIGIGERSAGRKSY